MTTNPLPLAVGPTAPKLGTKDLAQQFWADAYGKEVQTAATYSYTWLADQFGHLAIGIVAGYLATAAVGWEIVALHTLSPGAAHTTFIVALVLGWTLVPIGLLASVRGGWLISLIGFLGPLAASWWLGFATEQWAKAIEATHENLLVMLLGLGIAVIGIALWEVRAYLSSVKMATHTFKLDTKLLRDNAIIATVYMVLGALLCFGSLMRSMSWQGWFSGPGWPVLLSWLIWGAVIVLAIVLAVPWLRQKIIWQKAALPYLYRLSNATSKIAPKDATALQDLIEAGTPRSTLPCQIVIGGPIGSGRTEMAAAIGTEFAFKGHKVRYLNFNTLLEFAASFAGAELPDDSGPPTIGYWPWSQSQVVIIDDIGPLIAAREPRREANLERFSTLLEEDLKPIAGVLAQCHTIWILGDLRRESGILPSALVEFAKVIAKYCSRPRQPPPIIIELEKPAEPGADRKPKSATVCSVKLVNLSRSDA